MSEILMELNGTNGQLELYEDKVIIKRNGLGNKLIFGFKGDKTIYINQISGIEFKEAGFLAGYIQFTLPGGIERRGGLTGKDGAVRDENTVTFTVKQKDIARQIKEYVESRMNSLSQPSVISSTSDPDIIRKYKQLWDDGIITKDEFDAKKRELLGL